MEPTITTAVPKPKTGIKDFFLYVGFFVVLYTLIGNFINFAFSVINSTFPDYQYSYVDPYGSDLRMSISIIIVLTPVLIGLARKIHKDIKENAERANIWIRRWGLYITISLTIATLAVDLITLIYTYLGGEISPRFLWKVVVLALLASVVWLYSHAEIKGVFVSSPKRSLYSAVTLGSIVLVLVIVGISLTGTPSFLRQVKDDNAREVDLSNIQARVIGYYRETGALPISLKQITDGDPNRSGLPVDPKTGEEYGYSVLPPRTQDGVTYISFNLCADFEQDGTADDRTQRSRGKNSIPMPSMPMPYYEDSYGKVKVKSVNYDDHKVGQTCFVVEMNTSLSSYQPYNQNTYR